MLRELFNAVLPHEHNPRLKCPPGPLTPREGCPLLVASLKRSGTHVLMDLLLNNLPAYRRSPLYIDVTQYLEAGRSPDHLLDAGAFVCKTHAPQDVPHSGDGLHVLRKLAEKSVVLSPRRDRDQVFASMCEFGDPGARKTFDQEADAFDEFWSGLPVLHVPFADLFDEARVSRLLDVVCERAACRRLPRPVMPPARRDVARVACQKTLTRLLGGRCRVVNTTIRFAATR